MLVPPGTSHHAIMNDPEKTYLREDTGERLTGVALTQGGISLPQFLGDYPAVQIHLTVCG